MKLLSSTFGCRNADVHVYPRENPGHGIFKPGLSKTPGAPGFDFETWE
jgi:hypothetical protein